MQRNWRVAGLFALAITVWGLNYPFVKLGLAFSPPVWFACLRVLAAVAAVNVLLLAMKTRGYLTPRQKAAAFLLGIPGSAIFFGLWDIADAQIQPGLVSVFIYTYPLWTLFLSIPLLRDSPSGKKVAAAFLGFFGVALTSQIGFVKTAPSELGAMVELVVAGFGFALMTVCFKRLFKGEQLIRATAWQFAGAFVALAVWAGLTSPASGVDWSVGLLLSLLWVGVLGTAVITTVFFTLMSRYSASSLTAYFFLVVVVALVSSYFISGETIDAVQGAGVGAIIVAIYLVGKSDRQKTGDGTPAGSPSR